MRRVYLDHNATTPLAPQVFEAMRPFLTESFGNASSIHSWGQEARAAVEDAREQVAALIGAEPGEIVFTSGGTESDNAVLFGVLEAAQARNPGVTPHVITSAIEHPAVLNAAQALERRGVALTYVAPSSNGVVNADEIERAIKPETVLISLMHANNELGTLQPVEAAGEIARERRIAFHTDAVQSVGKVPVDLRRINAALLSLSAHKLNGPKGVGALYVRKGTPLRPLLYGGHHERDRRPGTENVAGIVGLGKAAELVMQRGADEARRLASLRDSFEAKVLESIPMVTVNGDRNLRVPSTSSISFDFINGESFVIAADLQGLACSTGSACSSGSLEPSHVLSAIGKSKAAARSTVRFSLGATTTKEDIDFALQVTLQVVERLRSLSPTYDEAASREHSAAS